MTTASFTAAVRRRRSLVEVPLALLCLWAAYFHTPLGALFRDVGARVFHGHSTARPLLSYYSGGELDFTVPKGSTRIPSLRPAKPVSSDEALAYGVWAGVRALPPTRRAEVLARLGPFGLTSTREVPDPSALQPALGKLAHVSGSADAAVLALFAGREPAQFAADQTRARGDALTIDALVDNLPPGYDDAAAQAQDVLALGTAYGLSWPLTGRVAVSSAFGMRIHPVLGEEKMHSGIDLPVPSGTPVHAVADGIVRRASEDALNGRMVIVDHGHGVTTAYLHNEKLLVDVGDHVTRGQVISLSGSTGRATGPHLHYQLELFGKPVDPLAFRAHTQSVARDEGP